LSSFINLSLILAFFVTGYVTSRLVKVPPAIPQRINKAVINFVFPAIILLNIPTLEFETEFLFLVTAPWMIVGLSALVILLINRRLHWSKETLCACLILAAVGNTGNLGYPMLKAFFTDQQAAMGIVFDQLGSFIALCTYVTILVAVYSGQENLSAPKILVRIFRFPPFITLLIALIIPQTWVTGPIETVLQLLNYLIIPMTMLSTGMQFRFSGGAGIAQPLAWTLTIKMLAAPLLVYFVGIQLNIPDDMLDVAAFQAAMPPMVAGVVLLLSQGLTPRFSVSALGFGTLFSLAYLPLVAWILNTT
jgi:predicted permease